MGVIDNYREYQSARDHLADVADGLDEETDEFLAANRAVADAEENVPWILRGW